ncbi:phosphotransferase [Jeotgalibacillus campisalis]|nr:phosphotransferase [Jeotgalibacillus campisalis]
MKDDRNETLLTGGNMTNVYLAEGTVRRELNENSANIHLLLQHLEHKKYPYSPRFRGIDEKGREILSFIEGEAGNYPLKHRMWSDESLTKIAQMQRSFHDAVEDFEFTSDWLPLEGTPDPKEMICHNDLAVYNIIFDAEKPVGIIDFDIAAPGPRIWDMAYTLYTCVPLSRFYLAESGEACFYNDKMDKNNRKRRIDLFFKAYGVEKPADLMEIICLRLEALHNMIETKAEDGEAAFLKMKKEGHAEHYMKDIEFIQLHRKSWA